MIAVVVVVAIIVCFQPFSALLFSELLFPWIQHLPDQLVQLGNSSPKTSSIIIGSIALTAMHMKTSMHMAAVLHASVNSLFCKLYKKHTIHLHIVAKHKGCLWMKTGSWHPTIPDMPPICSTNVST